MGPSNRAVCSDRHFLRRETSRDRFQGAGGSGPAVLSLSTLLLNQLADSQLFNTFMPLSWALNGIITASTNQTELKIKC